MPTMTTTTTCTPTAPPTSPPSSSPPASKDASVCSGPSPRKDPRTAAGRDEIQLLAPPVRRLHKVPLPGPTRFRLLTSQPNLQTASSCPSLKGTSPNPLSCAPSLPPSLLPFPGLTLSSPPSSPPTGSRASWAYDLSSYEAQRILNLVRDHPTPLPRTQTSTSLFELDQDERRARASRRVSLPIHTESAPISRSNSDMSLHPPMRRRSMIQTPGVATRTRPSPSSSQSAQSSFRHSHPPTPTMSRQPSLESNDGRFLSLPPLPSSHNEVGSLYRVLTPQDTDYSTTGAFKLGTLRITNGSPDLTPNVARALEAVDEQGASNGIQGDYFSKEPSSGSANVNLTSLSHSSSQAGGHQNPSVIVSQPVPGSSSPKLSISVPYQGLSHRYPSELKPSLDEVSPRSSGSPTLKTQSRQAAVDDHLFDDDDALEISVQEVLDVRIDANAKSPPRSAPEPIKLGTQGVQRTDSGFVSNSRSESSKSYSSLAKADSGYSSNVSLRSLRAGRKATAAEREPRTSVDSASASPRVQNKGLLTTSNEPTSATAQPENGPTPPPKDDASPTKQAHGDTPSTTTEPTPSRTRSVRLQTATAGNTQLGDAREEEPSDTSSPTRNSSEASSSSLSIGNNSQKPGRLQRLLSLRSSPFSKQALTVHVTHAVDNNRVPSIPKDVEEKLRERTGLFPMTTKRLALKNQMSKDTLKTILSVGSLESSKEDEAPSSAPIPPQQEEQGAETSDVTADTKDTTPRKNTFTSMQSNFRHAAMSAISNRKSYSRKHVPSPREESQEMASHVPGKDEAMLPTEAELTSYQSINSTLGNNAYDLAARALHTPAQTQPNRPENVRPAMRSAPSGSSPLQKHRSSPPVSMTTRGSFRPPPPRSPLSPQGPAVLRATSRVENTHHVATSRGISYQAPEGHRRGRSASGFQYRAASCGPAPAPRRMSVGSYGPSPSSSRHNSITSVQSDLVRGARDGRVNAQNPTGLDWQLKRQASLDGFSGTAHLAQPAHRGPTMARPGWNPQDGSQAVGDPYLDQTAWVPPPYVPRASHRRNLSAGSRPYNQGAGQPPYRILHSYNSPAYRNAPIWG